MSPIARTRARRASIPLIIIALAALMALFMQSHPAQGALTTTTLVSNTGRAAGTPVSSASTDARAAQVFTAGSSAAGYQLDEIVVAMTSDLPRAFDASIYSLNSANRPDEELYSLTRPSSFTGGNTTFTAPNNAELDAGTKYAIVFTADGTNSIFFQLADNGTGVDIGAAPGWSINDQYLIDSGGTYIANGTSVIKIQVRGAAFNNDPTFDTLSANITLSEDATGPMTLTGLPTATDDDGDTLTYSGPSATSPFAVNATTGVLTLKAGATLDHETQALYAVPYLVRDKLDKERDANDMVDATASITITITDLDETETLTIPSQFKAGTAATATLTGGDETSNVIWQWSRSITQSGTFTDISGATSATYTPTAGDFNYYLKVTVTYDDPFADDLTITSDAERVRAGNVDPQFSAETATRTLNENVTAVTNLGAPFTATDGDMDTLEYSFPNSTGDHDFFTIDSGTGQIKTKTSKTYDYESDSSYTLTVRVSDKKNAAGQPDTTIDDTITVTVNLNNLDEPGVATITGTLTGGETLTAVLTDPDGSVSNVTYQWEVGTPWVDFIGATSSSFRLVGNTVGKRVGVKINYNDGHGNSKSATHRTTGSVAAANDPPVFTDGSSTTRSVPENSAAGTNVGSAVAATDADMDTLTYSFDDSVGDHNSFTIESDSGQIKTKTGVTYNFEAAKNTYSVTVEVADGFDGAGDPTPGIARDRITVTINLTNVNEGPTISGTSRTSIQENTNTTQTIATYQALDPDAGDTFMWSITSDDDGGKFEIDSSGNLTLKNQLDFENPTDVGDTAGNNTYALKIRVQDAGGLSATFDAIITITNSNEAPEITTDTDDYTEVDIDENSPITTIIATYEASDQDDGTVFTWSLEGEDRNFFNITRNTDGHGELRFKASPDFEDPRDDQDADGNDPDNIYDIVVKVTDNHSPQMNDTLDVGVGVNDVNEAPTITGGATAKTINEGTTAIDTYSASDVDDGDSFTWDVTSADDGDLFEISSSGALSFKVAPDFEDPKDAGANNVYNVTVEVEDTGGLTATRNVAVTVLSVNEPPAIDSGPSSLTPDENTLTTFVIATYIASDPDGDDTPANLIWTLEGEDTNDFTLVKNSTTNNAELKFSSVPNYEVPTDDDDMDANDADGIYEITIKVADNEGAFDEIDVTITVVDLNETPVITADNTGTNGGATPRFPEIEYDVDESDLDADDYLVPLATYSAYDDDGDSVSWSVTGTDAAHFTIDSDGALSFVARSSGNRLNFEQPDDDDSNNSYVIVINANDGQGETDEAVHSVGTFDVTVTVTNIDETPEITTTGADRTSPLKDEREWHFSRIQDRVVAYQARDEEEENVTWSLAGADASDFTIETSAIAHGRVGTLFFVSSPDFEDPRGTPDTPGGDPDNTYEITVRVTDQADPAALTRELDVVVTVVNINERPEFTVTPLNVTVNEIEYDSGTTASDLMGITATTANQSYWYAFVARDEEGDDIQWTLTGNDAADLVITEDSGYTGTDNDERAIVRWSIVPNFEDPNENLGNIYAYTVNANDGVNNSQFSRQITVADVNERPQFTGTPTTSHTLNEHNSTLDTDFNEPAYTFPTILSYTAYDEEGGVTWTLTGTDAGDFEIDSGGAVTFRERPSFEHPQDSGGNNVYKFNVRATDVESLSPRRWVETAVTVTVRDIEEDGVIQVSNLNPAVAGPNNDADGGRRITFTLSDPDGGIKLGSGQLSWDLRALNNGVWEYPPHYSATTLTFTITVDADDTGKPYRADVRYCDRRVTNCPGISSHNIMSAATAPILADPAPNVAPILRSGAGQTIDEGTTGFLPDRLMATDRDGDTVTFGLGMIANYDYFEVNPTTGQVRLIREVDFEDTVGGILTAPITLSDGKGVHDNGTPNNPDDDYEINDDSVDVTETLALTVLDLEEEGIVNFDPPEPEVGTALTATVDDDDGNVSGTSWQWAWSQNGRTGWTNIAGATSNSYTPVEGDEDRYLRATVTYTDRRGSGKSAAGITTPVPSENRRPLFPSTETGQRTVDENSRTGTNIGAPVAAVDHENNSLTYSLTGADAASFTIVSSTGQIRVKDALDFETKSSYTLAVEVHDRLDSAGNSSNAIDDTQDVTITVENVEEPGIITLTSVTAIIQARAEVTASLEDDDGPFGTSWQWHRSPNGRTGWVTIAGATGAAYTPTLTDEGEFIRATASYDDGHGSGKTAQVVSPRVESPPPVNPAPNFPNTENGRREIAENATAGTDVGAPIAAVELASDEPGQSDPLVYSLTGTDAASFAIDSATGQISLAAGVMLDFETKRSYQVIVQVTDGRDENGDDDMDAIDDTQNVTITLTDVNEAPVVTGDETPSFQEDSTSEIARYTGTDPERDRLTWSVNNDDFWISDQGRLYFRSPPSFEGGTTSYSVTITAMDDDTTPLSGSLSVTITVNDAEEEGAVTITPPRGWFDVGGTQFTAELTDDDGGITGTSWQWARSPNRGAWTDIAGATSSTYTATADDVNQYLRAMVMYEDARSPNKTAEAVLMSRIGDTQPASNTLPQFTQTPPIQLRVASGTRAGRNVGSRVLATDTDQGEILTYSLSGTDADSFDINPATGQILTRAVLDHTQKDSYDVVVEVTDGFDATYSEDSNTDATIAVAITVDPPPVIITTPLPPPPPPAADDDDDEPDLTRPTFEQGELTHLTVPEDSSAQTAVGAPVTATTDDGRQITYTLEGPDASLFVVDERTGQISLAPGTILDFEGDRNEYEVDLVATVSRGSDTEESTITIVIQVTNVGLPGVANDYDANGDEAIDLDEALDAVKAYFAGDITLEQALGILKIYFQAPASGTGGNAP